MYVYGNLCGTGCRTHRQQAAGESKTSPERCCGDCLFAVLAGNDEWTEIADFAVDEKETLQKYLELPNGIPSHDTIQRVFFILRSDELQNTLVNILVQLVSVAGKKSGRIPLPE